MSERRSFALPDVGEGLTEAEILRWLVRPGDLVAVNQMVVEIETAKAAVELPCPFEGTVAELLAAEGTIVPVGSPIITIETADAPATGERQPVLVGYGVREGASTTRRARRGATSDAPPTVAPAAPCLRPTPSPAISGRQRRAGACQAAGAQAGPRAWHRPRHDRADRGSTAR